MKDERIIAAELKVRRNRPTSAQVAWLEALAAAGVETFLWTDTDWTSGVIENVLRQKRRQDAK